MKTKTHLNTLRIISLTVILSLLLASCLPEGALGGAAGADATEAPVVEEAPVEEPPAEEPPVEEPPVAEVPATEPPVAEVPATEPPVVEVSTTEAPIVDVATETPTPTSLTAEATVIGTFTSTPTPASGWDKSSIVVSGACNTSSGQVEFTITNSGSAMTGNTSWIASGSGVSVSPSSGTFSLGEGESMVIAFGPYPGSKVSIVVNQRVGHPGTGVAKADATCAKSAGSSAQSVAFTATPTQTPTHTATFTPAPTNTPAVPDPYLGLGVACNRDLSATFTIANIGGPMKGGTYTISEPGKGLQAISFDLGENESISFNTAGNATVTVKYATSELDQVNLGATGTCLPLPTNTPTQTSIPTKTFTPTKTATQTNTAGPSPTPTSTKTLTPTKTPTATNTDGPSPTPTATKTFTPTRTPTATNTDGPSPTPTATKTFTPTKTPKPTKTLTPTRTPTATNTDGPSPTPTLTKTYTPTNTVTFTPTITLTPTLTPTVEILDGQLDLKVFCNTDLSATFVITNISGPVSDGFYNLSDPAQSGNVDLPSGGRISINGAGYATMTVTYRTSFLSSVTLSTVGSCSKHPTSTPTNTPEHTSTPTSTPTNTPEYTPTFTSTPTSTFTPTASPTNTPVTPKLTAIGVCTDDTANATFTIANSGGDMPAAYTYNIKDSVGSVVKTGTIQLAAGDSTSVSASGNYGVLTLSITDDKGTTTDAATTTCTKSPKLTAVGVCTDDTADAAFTITNSGGDMPTAYAYTIKDSAGSVVKSGTFKLDAGSSEKVTASGTYGVLTLSITDDKGTTTDAATTTCVKPPKLTAIGVCTDSTAQATFVITNSGGNMSALYTYNIKDSASNVVKTGSFQLKAGESVTVSHSGTYGILTLSITDDKGISTDAATTDCKGGGGSGSLAVTGACTAETAQATFVITNSGSNMTAAYTYNVKDSAGEVVKTDTFQLKAGESLSVTVNGIYDTLTLFITDDKGTTTDAATTICTKSSKLTVVGVCVDDSGLATFIITNSGGDMSASHTYNIKDSAGSVVKTDTFKLKAGESLTVSHSGTYGVLTLSITDDKGTTTDAATTTCVKLSKLTVVGSCTANTGLATFVITNNGGDMPATYTYNIKDSAGKVLKTDTFQLKAGESLTVSHSGVYDTLILSITDDKGTTTDAATTTCTKSSSLTAVGACTSNTAQATFVITNNGGDMSTPYAYKVTDNTGKVVKADNFQLKAGGSLSITVSTGFGVRLTLSITDDKGTTATAATTTCNELKKETSSVPSVLPAKGQPCIQCLVFHTFRDDNLEIYRLDGIEGQPGFELFNLSKNGAVDSRPSRAPNDSGIVFQSNRDGNVELYLTDLYGSSQARLTNTQSNNTTPMYGPDAKTIVYQSDRNGNIDLFTIDKETHKELQITSDPADDVNPFYSPDLEWIVFQSNRENNWDVFILNTKTGNEFQLTSTPANETFPSWSPNGKQIAFIAEKDGKTDLYIVDTNGANLKQITTDGKTVNGVWSPEGSRIAYQSERNGNLDIYSYDLKDNTEYRVTDYAGQDSGPTWDCGGTNLAFTSIRNGDPNVFQVFWKGGPAGNMTIDPATDKWSQWRPSNDVSSTGY